MNTKDGGASVSRLGFVRDGLKKLLLLTAPNMTVNFDSLGNLLSATIFHQVMEIVVVKMQWGKYADTHKTNFGTWAAALTSGTASGTTNTPSHMTVFSAGEYLKKPVLTAPGMPPQAFGFPNLLTAAVRTTFFLPMAVGITAPQQSGTPPILQAAQVHLRFLSIQK